MTACPSCFQQVPVDTFAWLCNSGSCLATPDEQATAYLGAAVSSGPLTQISKPSDAGRKWAPPTTVFCSQCGKASSEVCPTCHYELLAGWREADVTCIAMNGARATGKSFYIAVVIHQLGLFLAQHNATVEFVNSHTRDIYRAVYENPLFEELGVIAPTPSSKTADSYQREPLLFSLGTLRGRVRYLSIRDVAGEEMETASESAKNLEFLRHADGVFFMFDPLAVSEIRDRLSDHIPQQLYQGGDARTVLGNFLRLLGGASPRVAVIVSKFDALQAFRDVDDPELKAIMSNPGAAFLRDVENPGYDRADGELLDLEVKSLLHILRADNFMLSLEQGTAKKSAQHRFFAVSVLGESPDGESLSKFGITPFRVLDPLKWILDARGVI